MAVALFSLELDSAALTRWQGRGLTSLTQHQGQVVASDGTHLYRLAGDTDDGEPIPVHCTLPATDGGLPGPKRLRAVRLEGVLGGSLAVTAASESDACLEGEAGPVGRDGLPGRVVTRLGRGHGRFWVLELSAEDGETLDIGAIELEWLRLDRRED